MTDPRRDAEFLEIFTVQTLQLHKRKPRRSSYGGRFSRSSVKSTDEEDLEDEQCETQKPSIKVTLIKHDGDQRETSTNSSDETVLRRDDGDSDKTLAYDDPSKASELRVQDFKFRRRFSLVMSSARIIAVDNFLSCHNSPEVERRSLVPNHTSGGSQFLDSDSGFSNYFIEELGDRSETARVRSLSRGLPSTKGREGFPHLHQPRVMVSTPLEEGRGFAAATRSSAAKTKRKVSQEYWKPKNYFHDDTKKILPDSYNTKYASKYSSGAAKWDEPDTVYGALSDKKPYSKVETGSSFFSTYGYTNRKKDYVAEKVRDYYYTGDQPKAITEGGESTSADVEVSEEKKERRKKKKSREPEETKAIEASVASESSAAPAAEGEAAPAAAAPAEGEAAPTGEDEVLDEKERKKLEKKKRKAEREAAAKAAMEAELEALAAAEAELAKLEADSSKPGDVAAPAPEAAPAADAAPAKCESPVPMTEEVDECAQPPLPPSPTPQQEPTYEEEAPLSPSPTQPEPEPQVEYEPEVVEPAEPEYEIAAPAEPEPEAEAELLGEAETQAVPSYKPQQSLEAYEPSAVLPTEEEEEEPQQPEASQWTGFDTAEDTAAADDYAPDNTTLEEPQEEPPLSPLLEAPQVPADIPQSPIETVTVPLPTHASPPPPADDDTQFLNDARDVEEEGDAGAEYGSEAIQREPMVEEEVEYQLETEQPAEEDYYEE